MPWTMPPPPDKPQPLGPDVPTVLRGADGAEHEMPWPGPHGPGHTITSHDDAPVHFDWDHEDGDGRQVYVERTPA